MCEWKSGPGKLSYPNTVSVKTVGRIYDNEVQEDNLYASFEVFGSHVQVSWYSKSDSTNVETTRSLSDEQEKYLIFLTKLWAITSYKYLRE
jgi:hypothetical protein